MPKRKKPLSSKAADKLRLIEMERLYQLFRLDDALTLLGYAQSKPKK